MTLTITPALPPLLDDRPDPGGASFEVLEALGERVAITFGLVRGEGPTWTAAPHTRFDGVGALAHLLREQGVDPGALPTLTRPADPGLLRTLWATLRHDPSGDRRPPARWRHFDPAARPGPSAPPPAWTSLTAHETADLTARARAQGASLNSLLLAALDRVVRTRWAADPGAAGLWMIPVNMRGAVRAARDTANQSAYLPVPVTPDADARTVHAEVKRLLAANVHWATWLQATLGQVIGRRLYARAIRGYHARSTHPWRGGFSNLGEWTCPGHDADGVVFVPPVTKTIPLTAGAITWRGRLGLALHAHPALAQDPAEWQACLDGWLAALV